MNRAAVIAQLDRGRRIAEFREDTTDDEKAEFPSLVAREYARAEARRNPSPQLDLAEAA